MNDLFDQRGADFSRLVESTNTLPKFVRDVLHQAVIDVTESGTKATAATAVTGTFGGGPPRVFEFTADRPFLFLIRHRPSREILFIGRFTGET